MKIISENTEKIILHSLEEISKDTFGWRAVHIKISQVQNEPRDAARKSVEQLVKILSDNETKIYLFSDFDVIAVFKGTTTTKIGENIYSALKQILTNLSGTDAVKLCNFYDLEKNINVVKSIVNRKIEIRELENKAHEVSKNEPEIAQITYDDVDPELLKTIQSRRDNVGRLKILLVEDDAFSRRLVKNILQKNYEVIEAENAREAYFKYIKNAPNIVFMDINLPDGSGMNLLENIAAVDTQSFIVMLSGNAYKDNILLSMQRGAKGFVAKPFPKEKIEGYLEKYKSEVRN